MNWKRALIAALAAAPLIWLFAFGFSRNPAEIPSPMPGRDAPPFALQVFAPGEALLSRAVGDTIRLREFAGKVLVVNFWASWCIPCREEHAALTGTAREYAGRPVQFVGVLYNDRPEAGTRWIAELGGQSYPAVLDVGARTAIDYGLYGVPETFIIDAKGRIAYKHTGAIAAVVLRQKIDSLLAGAAAPKPAPPGSAR